MSLRLTLDFETASACDLKKAGAWRYAEDPTTEILCCAWVDDRTNAYVWIPGVTDHFLGILKLHVADPTVIFEAHNVAFEQAIWHYIMVGQLGMPPIPIERWDDTAARCLYTGAPAALEDAARVLGLAERKDMVGSKLTIALSKPMTQVAWMEKRDNAG